jgi:hypothetical protein
VQGLRSHQAARMSAGCQSRRSTTSCGAGLRHRDEGKASALLPSTVRRFPLSALCVMIPDMYVHSKMAESIIARRGKPQRDNTRRLKTYMQPGLGGRLYDMVLMLHMQGSVLTTGIVPVGIVVVHACVASRAASLTGAVPSCVDGACTTSSSITRQQRRSSSQQTDPQSAVWADQRSRGLQTLPAQPGNGTWRPAMQKGYPVRTCFCWRRRRP